MTLEEAQEQILELREQLETAQATNDTLSQDNENLKADNENLRTLNQKYFNRLIAQDVKTEAAEPEEVIPTCEQFAEQLYNTI